MENDKNILNVFELRIVIEVLYASPANNHISGGEKNSIFYESPRPTLLQPIKKSH